MILMFVFAFNIIRPIIFSAVKKVTFPQSSKFSTVKEFFHNQIFFFRIKGIFHSQ